MSDSRILHELAGAASLCWQPKPTGVFDTQEAIKQVESALSELRKDYVPRADYDAIVAECDEYKAGFKEAMTDHAATLERLADCERQRDEPCGFKGDEPTCLVASRLKARLEERERELEYAYRVVHCGVVFGNFDFSILRVRAALFVESKDGQCSSGSAGGET